MADLANSVAYYRALSVSLRDNSFRASMDKEELTKIALFLEEIHNKCKDVQNLNESIFLETLQTVFRCLRNACIACHKNQSILIETRAVNVTLSILLHTLQERDDSLDKKELGKLAVLCLQFLGNLVACHPESQEKVWMRIRSKTARYLLQKLDDDIKDILCMVIFNCIRNRPNFFDEHDAIDVMLAIIEHCKSDTAEWGMLIIEDIISSGKLKDLYENIYDNSEHRPILLDIFLAYVDDGSLRITEDTMLYLSHKFELSAKKVMVNDKESTDDSEEIGLFLISYLRILCAATSFLDKYRNLLQRTSLLEHAVHLLKFLSLNVDKYNVQRKCDNDSSCDGSKALVGLKRDLVRLIGNMCYSSRENQNTVRHLDGIQAILNNCKIDDRNPYICQWSIFAVRNLCKDNLENQLIVSELERQGLAENNDLTKEGIKVKIENHRIRVSMEKTTVDRSINERRQQLQELP